MGLCYNLVAPTPHFQSIIELEWSEKSSFISEVQKVQQTELWNMGYVAESNIFRQKTKKLQTQQRVESELVAPQE